MRIRPNDLLGWLIVPSMFWCAQAFADAASSKKATPSAPAALAATSPPSGEPGTPSPYSLPFQLRSLVPRTSVRIDTTVAPYQHEGDHALEAVIFFGGLLRLTGNVFLNMRWGFADNRVGNGEKNRTGIVNPTFGVLVTLPMGAMFRFAAFTTLGIPIATGGGVGSDANAVLLQRQGALARSAMDNTMFALNDVAVPTGVGFAFIHHGLTAQAAWTIIASGRVKGPSTGGDIAKVNSTTGAFLAYYVLPDVSLGTELRYQYFLVPPESLAASARSNLTAGFGARIDIELGDSSRMRPGACYSVGLDGPVADQSYSMVQFDIPIAF